jgi:hypothetical protein
VFWVHADNETTFTQDYKVIAKRLGLAPAGGVDGSELLTAVRERIEAHPSWLLILDNADNLAVFGVGHQDQGTEEKHSLYDFVPWGPAGTVLWTSRDKRIGGSLVGARRAINVASMSEREAKILLETVGGRGIAEEESYNAMALLAELDWFPLAVSQAAAYMRRTATPIAEYLSLRKRMKSKTEFDRHRRKHVSNNVMDTWNISIEHIRQENQMACDILYSLAFVDNQNIPFALIAKAAEIIGRPTKNEEAASAKSACSTDQDENQDENQDKNQDENQDENQDKNQEENQDDNNDILAAVVLLQDFSFLRLRTSGERHYQAYEMHKLVQEATQYSLSQANRRKDELHFSEVALWTAISLFPELERRQELWGECERYLGHAQRAAEWAGLCEREVEAAALLTRVSEYLHDRGRWREREPVDESAYEYRRKVLGERHPDTIRSIADLATTYYNQGRYHEAENMKVVVLALRCNVLGEKHPDTIQSMANLGAIYHAQRRHDEAQKMAVEVLALQRDVLGERHPDTLQAMHNLAITSKSRQQYPEALAMMQECFRLQCEVLGQTYPSVQRSLHLLNLWKEADMKKSSRISQAFGRLTHHIKARISP